LPIRTVSEILGKSVEWNEERKEVIITDKDYEKFFPVKIGDEDTSSLRNYSDALQALGEHSIFAQKYNFSKFIIRFTCLRSFDNPFSIRVEIYNNPDSYIAYLYFKKCAGISGDNGILISDTKKKLTNNQLNELLECFHEGDEFFKIPVFGEEESGCDGSSWIIEVLDMHGNYNVVERWSPDEGKIYDLGKLLIKLSGQYINRIY
jgi:hypothetical protein